jgi:hypothetical protein
MAIRDQIMQMAQSDPRFTQAVDAMEKAVINMPVTPEDLEEVIELLEVVVQDPSKYAEMRQAAIDDGEIDENVLPAQFDMVYIVSLLVALYGLQDRLSEKGYARGGLTVGARRLAAQGRGGDTELAHVNRREAEMLRRAGGSGGINPATGLREYKFKWGKILAAAAPIVLTLVAPGIGTAIGGAISGSLGLGLGAIGQGILGGAVLGAGSSLLGGGNPLTGAVGGALGGGLGGEIGSLIPGLSGTGFENIVGTSLVGAGTAAATGRNPFSGALRGALGAAAGDLSGKAANELGFGPGATSEGLQRGIGAAGKGFGIGLATGMDPKAAAIAGGLSGLAAGVVKPSQAVVSGLQQQPQMQGPPQPIIDASGNEVLPPGAGVVLPDGRPGQMVLNQTTGMVEAKPLPGQYAYNPTTRQVEFKPQQASGLQAILNAIPGVAQQPGPGMVAPTGGGGGLLGGLLGGGQGGQGGQGGLGGLLSNPAALLAGAAALSSLRSAPAQAQQAVSTLPASQQEYFNRPNQTWDWNRMQRDAAASGMGLSQYMATNWPRITSGQYNTQAMAQGGALSAVARFARGAGTGRSDEIDAKLSDGEYVIDAETVAMLGDGSSKAGAQRLDKMREEIRSHKGKALAKGKFSPDAKSPLSYLKGVA